MNENEERDLAALRAFAEENSERNKVQDHSDSAAALFAFTWLGTQAVWIFLVFKTRIDPPWYLGLVISTFLGFAIVRWNKYLSRGGTK